MESKKKEKLLNYASFAAILFFISVMIVLYFHFQQAVEESGADASGLPESPVYFNEIMTNNLSYPDKRGIICDWAELYNSSDEDIDVGGYVIYDEEQISSLVLPDSTVIKSKSFLLISFGGGKGDYTAPFSLSKNGDETLVLCDANDAIADIVALQKLKPDFVMVRSDNGGWDISGFATPLFENDYEKYDAFISARKTDKSSIIITEVMSKNSGRITDDMGRTSDWLEITNVGDTAEILSDYFISDDDAKPYKFRLPERIIEPGESILIFATGEEPDPAHEANANFKISSEGEMLYLYDWRGILLDTVDMPPMLENYSYSRLESGMFIVTAKQTPGFYGEHDSSSADGYNGLVISEVCPSNRSGLRDADGDWSDWIELENSSGVSQSLDGLWLSVDTENIYQFKLPDMTLESGGHTLIFASNKKGPEGEAHANFRLSAHGETISLYTGDGYLIDSIKYENAKDDMSYVPDITGGNAVLSEHITPGYENTINGRVEYMESVPTESPLIISEVMTSNSRYLPAELGENYDWIELKNNSEKALNLLGYRLTDNLTFPDMCMLPDASLKPGETFLVICSGDASKSRAGYFHAGFVLSAEYSPLYLLDPKGNPADYVTLYEIPPDKSYGRMPGKNGFYYFDTPSPGADNTEGVYGVALAPVPSLAGGAYKTGDNGLSLELMGEGDIYYTLDGRLPNAGSKKYTEPIEITETCVVRAYSVRPDMLPSEVTSSGYFLNTEHELPILSLSVNPRDMYDEDSGIYVKGNSEEGNYYKDWEKKANLTLYDTVGGGFSIDCGLKMHGGGSRRSDNKKSMKVIFRSKYGEGSLKYDLFGENTPDEFTSLVIRAGEDYRYTIFRSEMLSELAKEANPDALTQAHKYCVLYVNGEYFGIFALMERYNEEYYAARYNVTPESVNVVDAADFEDSAFYGLVEYCRSHKMDVKENYDYICDNVDIGLLIDWCVFQAFSGNTDIPFNVRLINSSEGDGKWRYCLYDLDWTMRKASPVFDNVFDEWGCIFELPRCLMANDEFRQQLLDRAEELRSGVLSDEHVLEKIEEYYELLGSELPRDRKRWYIPMSVYEQRLELLRAVVRDNDRWETLIESLSKYFTIYENGL